MQCEEPDAQKKEDKTRKILSWKKRKKQKQGIKTKKALCHVAWAFYRVLGNEGGKFKNRIRSVNPPSRNDRFYRLFLLLKEKICHSLILWTRKKPFLLFPLI